MPATCPSLCLPFFPPLPCLPFYHTHFAHCTLHPHFSWDLYVISTPKKRLSSLPPTFYTLPTTKTYTWVVGFGCILDMTFPPPPPTLPSPSHTPPTCLPTTFTQGNWHFLPSLLLLPITLLTSLLPLMKGFWREGEELSSPVRRT